MNDTLKLIASRRSHRAYRPEQITSEQLDALLTAAVQAPSAVNRQPWHFTVVQNAALLHEINQAAAQNAARKENRSPRFENAAFDIFYHAPTVIFLSADTGNRWAPIDCGIAVQTLALAAESMGLGSVILGLPREAFESEQAEELKRKLSFPAGYDFVIAIAVGVPADTKEAHPVQQGKITKII